MEIARIEVSRTTGVCTRRERIPAGIAGASVQVSFTDPVWDNLIKTVVFRGKETKIAEFDGAVAEIPHEVIPEPRIALYFGIFGHDPDTDLQIPLIEVYLGTTEKSTDANADPGTDPTLPIWAQLKADVADLTERVENMTPGGPGGDVDLDGYATEQWVKDQKYLTAVPDGYAKTSEIPKKAEDIGALPNTYTPPNQTAEQVGADPKGTAESAVSKHNTSDDAHTDLRLALKEVRSLVPSDDHINSLIDDKLDSSGIVYVNVVQNSNGKYTADKTVPELLEAYSNGRTLMCLAHMDDMVLHVPFIAAVEEEGIDNLVFTSNYMAGALYINLSDFAGVTLVTVEIVQPEMTEDVFSPIATVEQTSTGAIISITDKNGNTTATITNGKDGITPQRGTDYWTASDIAEIKSYVDEAILGGAW